MSVKSLLEMFEEEFKLLRKLMIEYWGNTEDAKDGTIDLEMSYEDWALEYIYDLMLSFGNDVKEIKKELRKVIVEYIERLNV